MTDGETTVDGALGNALQLVQPARGYRFSLDAVLLARFAAEQPARQVLDLGCGCGVVGLALLALAAAEQVCGIDVQAHMVSCARASAERNGWAQRATFRQLDLCAIRDHLPAECCDLVVANPPFRAPGAGRVSPNPAIAVARHEVCCQLGDVVRAAGFALRRGGACCLVYPAERLPLLLAACSEVGLPPRQLRCLHPRRGEPARLVLLRCVKGNGEGLVVRPPLVLHEAGGAYAAEAATLLGPP